MGKSVLILGTARAGTSMTCGVVKRLGVNVLSSTPSPRSLLHNPKGNYEFLPFMMLGSEINKKQAGLPHQDIDELIQTKILPQLPSEEDWGFKVLGHQSVPYLLPYIPNPHVICVFRNFYDQAISFQRLRKINDHVETQLPVIIAEIAKAYHEIADMALELLSHVPVAHVSYLSLRTSPAQEAERLARFLEIDATNKMIAEIVEYVDVI